MIILAMTVQDIYEVNRRIFQVWCPDFHTSSSDLPYGLMWNPNLEPTVLCNDVFFWGCADAEDITIENIQVYEQAVLDIRALPFNNDDESERMARSWAGLLFASRLRNLRPQSVCYPAAESVASKKLIELFDAAGPVRDVDIFNPYRHPSDGGGYAYDPETCDAES